MWVVKITNKYKHKTDGMYYVGIHSFIQNGRIKSVYQFSLFYDDALKFIDKQSAVTMKDILNKELYDTSDICVVDKH